MSTHIVPVCRAALSVCALTVLLIALVMPAPARAGIGDWWDILSGYRELEIRRLDRQADVAIAWRQARLLREVADTLSLALWRLKPPQIEELEKALDDRSRWNSPQGRALDRLRLPAKDGRRQLSVGETRDLLGLPQEGLAVHGLAVLRCSRHMVVYHDTGQRRFPRFGDNARQLLDTLNQDIRRNPPVARSRMNVDRQLDQYMPLLIASGRMLRHAGSARPLPDCGGGTGMASVMPRSATIGLISSREPNRITRIEPVGACPDGETGEVFETVELINGGQTGKARKRHNTCMPKPDPGTTAAVSQTQSQNGCGNHPGMENLLAGLLRRHGLRRGDFDIRGDFARTREKWTQTATFPQDWGLRPMVLAWEDDWVVRRDDCRVHWQTPGRAQGGSRTVRHDGRQCTQRTERPTLLHWRQSPGEARRRDTPHVSYGDRRDVGKPDCPEKWITWTSKRTETGSRTVNGCKQKRQRVRTTHWRRLDRPGSARQYVRTSYGSWRDVGKRDCPDKWLTSTTTETETGSRTVNGCTQKRQRVKTKHWRRLDKPGSAKQYVRTSYGSWRDVGKPDCPPTWDTRTTARIEYGSYTINGCTQKRQRLRILTYRKRSDDPGPGQLESVTHGPWFDSGKPVCPPPVTSTTVTYQWRSTCIQTQYESRHTAAEYRLLRHKRQVTHHWLTYHDGRREAGKPPYTFGSWVREGSYHGSCRPGSGGGGGGSNNGSGGHTSTTYDTTGDGRTDSHQPGPAGHFGASTSGMGSQTGFTPGPDHSGGSRGQNYGGGGRDGPGVSGGVFSPDSFDSGNNSGSDESGGDPWGGLR